METIGKLINVGNFKGFDIYFEPLESDIDLSELLPDNTKKEIQEMYDNNVVFCARVYASRNGIELASDFLGGCIYEKFEDFYTKYKNDHFNDMVETVINESKEMIKKLIE